ncbi:MAG: ribosome silencing factor [Nitrospira bacterium SG8_35_1]|jgi:ribosome-associated protein|nr:MAG: ribosome silencing factor [Nitrospira bacterium SG8_35_1]
MQQVKKKHRNKSSQELARLCVRAAIDKKAEDPVILDVRKLCSFTDFFVVISGRSTRHVQGLAEAIETELRSKKLTPSSAEGLNEGTWVLLDFNDIVVHIFYSETRKFYDIEGLWHDAPRISLDDTPAVAK